MKILFFLLIFSMTFFLGCSDSPQNQNANSANPLGPQNELPLKACSSSAQGLLEEIHQDPEATFPSDQNTSTRTAFQLGLQTGKRVKNQQTLTSGELIACCLKRVFSSQAYCELLQTLIKASP